MEFTSQRFAEGVLQDFESRQRGGVFASKSLSHGERQHPCEVDLPVGKPRTAAVTVAFLDLTDFTGRTFWDDPIEVVNLAHAVMTGFMQTVTAFGGYPLGSRGDGLFAAFGPGNDRAIDAVMTLGACSFALNAIETEVNPRLEAQGIRGLKARAGLDFGDLAFVRSGDHEHSAVNHIGFAANFAAKCEKKANSWEVVVGQGLARLIPDAGLKKHSDSPKEYQRDYHRRTYDFYHYAWRPTVPHLPSTLRQLNGSSTPHVAIS